MSDIVSSTNTIKAVFKNISWLTLQDLILQPLGLLFFIILGRKLGDTGLGLYSYIFTLGTFFSYILDFGLTTFFWRKWSSKPEEYKNDLPWVLGYRTILLIPFTVLFAGYVLFLEKSEHALFLLVYFLFALESIRSIPLYYAQATNQFKKVMILNVFDKGLVFILSSVLLLLNKDLLEVLLVHLGFRLLSTLYAFSLFKQPLQIKISLANLARTLKPSAILLIIQMLTMVFFKVDTVMIKFLLNIDAVGLYSASYKLIEASLLIPNIVLAAVFPSLMRLKSIDAKESKAMLDEIINYLLLLGVFFAVICQIHAKDFIDLIYGQDFNSSTLSLKWLSWSLPFLFVNAILIAKMLAHHKEKELLIRSVVLIIVNVVLNFFLLKFFYITGAAIATLVCEITNFLLLLKLTSVRLPILPLIKIASIVLVVMMLGTIMQTHYLIQIISEVFIFSTLAIILKLFSIKRVIELIS